MQAEILVSLYVNFVLLLSDLKMERIDTFLLTLSNIKSHENLFSVYKFTCRQMILRQTDMVKAVGVLANGAKVHRFTSIVREGLEFIDFDLFMVYLTVFSSVLKDKIKMN
jgi:hypothetical protein